MPLVTSYATLQTWIISVLARIGETELAVDVPNFIQDCEARLRRDERARLMVDLSPFIIDVATTPLPADFDSFADLTHIGPTFFGPIAIVPLESLGLHFAELGLTGVPAFGAIVANASGAYSAKWAPAPNATFSVNASYFAKLTALSGSNTSNRMLEEHPDIYRYAALVESAPYLKDDDRVPLWEQELQQRLDELEDSQQRAIFGGTLSRLPPRVF